MACKPVLTSKSGKYYAVYDMISKEAIMMVYLPAEQVHMCVGCNSQDVCGVHIPMGFDEKMTVDEYKQYGLTITVH